jgi:uncharacterized membrane protein
MNTQRIATAVREIDRLTLALNWLREYGDQLQPQDRNSFKIHIDDVVAFGVLGVKEAREQMGAIARLYIQDIIQHAIKDAANTIEIHTETIRNEACPEVDDVVP